MTPTVTITDPMADEPVQPSALDRIFLPFLKDERDLIFVRTATQITCILLPAALILFLSPPWLVALLALPYIAIAFVGFGGRYGLMLHAVGHRPIFKREYRFVEHYIPWVLGPFLGHTPTSFDAHHMWMHHAENNMLGDGSTTLPYQRDKFSHFVHYWARFFFFGYVHLSRYLWLRGRKKTLAKFWMGELSWYALVACAALINPAAAFVVFVTPMLMMRWFMMAGNFAQHSFVDIEDPDNAYKNSTCLTNTIYNHKAYNDGYHIVHHIRAGMHWSEMPKFYLDNLDEFARQDAVCFNGIRDNQAIWFLLMTHNYDKLANHLVDFKGRTHEERVAFLKSRVRPRIGDRLPSLVRIESREDMQRTARKQAA